MSRVWPVLHFVVLNNCAFQFLLIAGSLRTIGEPSAFDLHERGAQVFSYLHCKIRIGCSCQHLRATLRELSLESFVNKYSSLVSVLSEIPAGTFEAGQRHKELSSSAL